MKILNIFDSLINYYIKYINYDMKIEPSTDQDLVRFLYDIEQTYMDDYDDEEGLDYLPILPIARFRTITDYVTFFRDKLKKYVKGLGWELEPKLITIIGNKLIQIMKMNQNNIEKHMSGVKRSRNSNNHKTKTSCKSRNMVWSKKTKSRRGSCKRHPQ